MYNFGGAPQVYSYAQYYPRLNGARPKLPNEITTINYDGGYMADMLMSVRGLYIKEKTDWV